MAEPRDISGGKRRKSAASRKPKTKPSKIKMDNDDDIMLASAAGGSHGGGNHGGGSHGGGSHGGGTHGPSRLVALSAGLDAPAERPGRIVVGMGWHPDIPDFRDRHIESEEVAPKLKASDSLILTNRRIPSIIDHRGKCSPVEDQGRLGSCTAQAVVGLMEYMMRVGGIAHIDGSRLFVYKVSRKLLGWNGDTGAYLRTTMNAVSAFGVPPEKHFPYDIARYEEEPSPFLYSYADRFKSLNYTRLDPPGLSPDEVLASVKRTLAAGYCAVFGFSVYSSISYLPDIPFPTREDSMDGGHAVMAIGYDDDHMVGGVNVPSLIIRNSWGTGWGEQGYGYLPYEYVLSGLAQDFWTSFKWEWIDTNKFG